MAAEIEKGIRAKLLQPARSADESDLDEPEAAVKA
jgi:hypothetical protein